MISLLVVNEPISKSEFTTVLASQRDASCFCVLCISAWKDDKKKDKKDSKDISKSAIVLKALSVHLRSLEIAI